MTTTPYLVLARKYRPRQFGEMAGQDHVVRTLSNSLRTGQLAHAFLFTGPRGVGKTTSARLVARALNCERGPTAEPCGVCAPCVEIAEGRSVDVIEIDAASNNGVDNVRDIVEAVKYRPARDRFKVFVVDEVHMLSTGAFNALLKTLEEPPPHVKFVLATTDVHKVPETIVSRCQRFDFHRLTVQQIVDQLAKVAAAEGIRVSPAALALVARQAEGGMRDALSMLDQLRAACGDSPEDAAVAEALGAVDAQAISRMGAALVRRDGAALLAEVDGLHAKGLEMKRVAEELARHLRNVVVARLVPGAPLDLPDAEVAEVRAQAGTADPAQLVRLFDLVQRSVEEVKLAEGSRHALEVALLAGVFLAPGAQVAELVARLDALASPGGSAPPTPAAASPGGSAPPAPPAPAGFRDLPESSGRPAPVLRQAQDGRTLGAEAPPSSAAAAIPPFGTPGCAAGPSASGSDVAAWRAAVEAIEKVSPMAAPALKQAVLLSWVEGEVAVSLAPGIFAQTAEKRRGEIEAELSRLLGRPTRLVVTVGAPPPAGTEAPAGPPATLSIAAQEAAERQERSARVRETAQTHGNIREAARILGGGIQKVEEL